MQVVRVLKKKSPDDKHETDKLKEQISDPSTL
jgi:hypothetical protein